MTTDGAPRLAGASSRPSVDVSGIRVESFDAAHALPPEADRFVGSWVQARAACPRAHAHAQPLQCTRPCPCSWTCTCICLRGA